ncbi:TonB-dependent siderophore receptor [Aliikangiella sp. G2MR2-5]|uniref:TonB-dependent receptor plug domain-containing protein n=1 Tax=Aliikangiella sp. G2MR2-5 TaxID=2788943 RepID=UPI0018A95361|nr:TonB-dependent receptor [Aliikangiella sp. G2MR2-5]
MFLNCKRNKNNGDTILSIVFRKVACCFLFGGVSSGLFAQSEGKDILALSLEDLLKVKVESASGFKESIKQTPVPVTVITQNMIEQSPALNIRDLLSQYVPGFTSVQDQNEYNTAFRGIYTSSQQKILFLLNGQRINSRAYSSAAPDHSISLDKLKQIEVIRGPGSSLYGNVALTAVVNLVMKNSASDEQTLTKVSVGDHGLANIYVERNIKLGEGSLFTWASNLRTKGEEIAILPENDYSPSPSEDIQYARLDYFDDNRSVDSGILFTAEDWSALVSYRRTHYIEPFSGGSLTGEAYNLSDFVNVDGSAPGAESEWVHLNLEKNIRLSDLSNLKLELQGETNQVTGYFVLSPAQTSFGAVNWRENVSGLSIQYQHKSSMSMLALGFQFEGMELKESDFVSGSEGEITARPYNQENPVLETGTESVYSVYSQYRRQLTESWLVNLGARYDVKDRHTGENINELSPRLAFIFNDDDYNFKASYSRSFVDPPYWNRYSALPTFRGSRDLKPEILESIQLSPEFLWLDKSLSLRLNLFFNRHTDFVFRNNLAAANEPIYTNSGEMESYGLEQEWLYRLENNRFRLITSLQRVNSFEFYEARGDEIFNIPKLQAGLTWDYQATDKLSSQVHVQYIGERLSPVSIASNGVPVVDSFPDSGVEFQVPNNRLDSVLLLHSAVSWKWSNHLRIKLAFQNLLNERWEQGGSTIHPYPQTGRWGQVSMYYQW